MSTADEAADAGDKPESSSPEFSAATQIPAALLVLVGFIVVASWKPDLVWQALVAAALAGLILNLHRLESLKIGTSGLEAKLRQRIKAADKKLDELSILAGELRELAKPVLEAGMIQINIDDRIMRMDRTLKRELMTEFVRVATKLGIRDAKFDYHDATFHRFEASDLLRECFEDLGTIRFPVGTNGLQESDVTAMVEAIAWRGTIPQRAQLETWLGDLAAETDVRKRLDAFYEYVQGHDLAKHLPKTV